MKKTMPIDDLDQLKLDFELLEVAGAYMEEAMVGLSGRKLEETILDWAKGHILYEPDESQSDVIMSMALDACLFAPSISGSTAMDRFVKAAKAEDPIQRDALKALSRSEIRLVKVVGRLDADLVELEDCFSRQRLIIINDAISDDAEGLEALMRLCQLDSGRYIHINPSFVLTPSLRVVADGYVRSGKGISNAYRCAVAVYKHAVREGVVPIPRSYADGLESVSDEYLKSAAAAAIIHSEWIEAKDDPAAFEELVEDMRREANAETLLAYLRFHDFALDEEMPLDPDVFREICAVIVETLIRQKRFGLVHAAAQIESVRQAVSDDVRDGYLEKRSQQLLESLLASFGSGMTATVGNAELDRVVQRIRALQAKTVDQGCTEEEAVAAAEKAAELLDRYSLDLTEASVREIGCEAARYGTGRKKRNDMDLLCMTVARFFDCQGWLTKSAQGEIEHVFFGFRADAEAARVLVARICEIIDDAADQFKRGDIYAGLAGGGRRSAVSSFKAGMSHGISQKLARLKKDRVTHANRNSGTALVVVKQDMVRDELSKLGLAMRVLPAGRSRMDARSFDAGRQSGLLFDIEDRLE